MEPIIIYLLKVNVAFAILYGIYKLAFTRDTFFNLRRFVLLGICIVSLIYPFIEIPTIRYGAEDNALLSYAYNVFLPEVTITDTTQSHYTSVWSWSNVLFGIYLLGMGLLLFRSLMEIGNLFKIRSKCRKQDINGITVYANREETEPFSFMQWIFLSPHSYSDSELDEVLTHENTHAREWHSLDIIFIQLIIIFNWLNPFVWLLRSEIRINHEYLADRNVIFSGYNKKNYQYHLIGLTANPRMAAANLYNNFSVLPLKNRLKMLNKKETSNIMITKYLMFIPVFLFLLVFSNCTETTGQDKGKEFGDDLGEVVVVGYGKEGVEPREAVEGDFSSYSGEVYDKPDVLPEYPGGETALMQFLSRNIRYPQEAQDKGIQGRVTLRMIIEKDGSINTVEVLKSANELLDKEAIRIVKLLPKWTPGKNKGEPVRVGYTLPVQFRFQ